MIIVFVIVLLLLIIGIEIDTVADIVNELIKYIKIKWQQLRQK